MVGLGRRCMRPHRPSSRSHPQLTRGATSCSCTVSDFESTEGGETNAEKLLPPGGAAKLLLKWRGKTGGAFRQQATVFTNDPRRPEIVFVVEGFVVPVWKAEPKSIVLTSIPSQGGVTASSKIFTYGKEPAQVAAVSTSWRPSFSTVTST